MKAWLEEYGLIMVVVVVAMVFIGFATPVAESIKDAVIKVVNSLLSQGGITG